MATWRSCEKQEPCYSPRGEGTGRRIRPIFEAQQIGKQAVGSVRADTMLRGLSQRTPSPEQDTGGVNSMKEGVREDRGTSVSSPVEQVHTDVSQGDGQPVAGLLLTSGPHTENKATARVSAAWVKCVRPAHHPGAEAQEPQCAHVLDTHGSWAPCSVLGFRDVLA